MAADVFTGVQLLDCDTKNYFLGSVLERDQGVRSVTEQISFFFCFFFYTGPFFFN